jgi:uncharacterized membrane protein HdeD (DUF308 family)
MLHSNTNIDIHSLSAGMVTKNRKRLMGYGILSVIFGFVGLYMSTYITISSILIVGIFLLIMGVVFIVEVFSAPDWKGKRLNLALSILYTAAGLVMVVNPVASAVWFTLFLAVFLAMIGVLRIIMAFQIKSQTRAWAWVAFGGMLNIILGVLVYMGWPQSGLWVIGMFISIELIIHGFNAIVLSRIVKETQKEGFPEKTA